MAENLHNKVNRKLLRERILNDPTPRLTLSFYKYHEIKNVALFRDHLYLMLDKLGVLGRIYVAPEGINAQASVPEANAQLLRQALDQITFLNGIRLNYAVEHNKGSFFVLKVQVKRSLVADGLPNFIPDQHTTATHVKANQFNSYAKMPGTVIIDMRNHYETEVGYFENAIIPDSGTFIETLEQAANLLAKKPHERVLMYCTGGIRCEKAGAFLAEKGFKNLFQLEGGIINYAHQVREQNLENLYKGKNFVFDERLGERISGDVVGKCYQCGEPCDVQYNCANQYCHNLIIQCPSCAEKYNKCCSQQCTDFVALPSDVQHQNRHQFAKPNGNYRKGPKRNLQNLSCETDT